MYLESLVPAAASEQLEVSAPTQENISRRVQHLQVRPRILKGQSQEKNMSTFQTVTVSALIQLQFKKM